MTPQDNNLKINRLLTAACVVLAIACVIIAAFAVQVRLTTGTLTVKAFSSDAVISVSQHNKTAAIIGTGSTGVHLAPGTYEVVASNGSKFADSVVVIQKQQTTALDLKVTPPAIPTPDDITFNGIEEFYKRGLSESQVANLQLLFFHYNRHASTVTIDTNSIQNGPRDPSDDSAPFTQNFTGQIDSKAYKATITYSADDLDNLVLTLSDPQTGAQLFNASSVPST